MDKTRRKVKIIKKKLSTGNNQLPLLRITLNSVRRRSSIMFQTDFYLVYDYKEKIHFPFYTHILGRTLAEIPTFQFTSRTLFACGLIWQCL